MLTCGAEASGCLGGTINTSSSRYTTTECRLGFLGLVGQHAEFGVVAQDVVGDVAAQSAFDRDLDHGMQAAEFGQQRQQVEHGELVGRDHQLAFLQFPQFGQRFGGLSCAG